MVGSTVSHCYLYKGTDKHKGEMQNTQTTGIWKTQCPHHKVSLALLYHLYHHHHHPLVPQSTCALQKGNQQQEFATSSQPEESLIELVKGEIQFGHGVERAIIKHVNTVVHSIDLCELPTNISHYS